MSTDTWQAGTGDWNTAAEWSGGVPSGTTTAAISGSGNELVTLMGNGSAAALSLNAASAEFYLAGALSLTGSLGLQAGTFALAGGVLAGGTLAMQGGAFLSTGGTFSAVQVNGPLLLNQPDETLFVSNGLTCYGAAGSGLGSLSLTGAYDSLDFIGSQALRNTQVTLGAPSTQSGQVGPAAIQITHAANASAGATLILGAAVNIMDSAGQAQIVVGSLSPVTTAPLQDVLDNFGLIAASSAAATFSIAGNGTLLNQGTISVANGATLDIATQGFVNTGAISVDDATLALGGTFAGSLLSSLGSVALSSGTVSLAGTANLNGATLSLGTGSAITRSLGALLLDGTIMNGTVLDAGGGLNFAGATGTLSGATYRGSLMLGAGGGVTLANGAAVSGSIAVTGAGASLLLSGLETLNNVGIALGAAGSSAELGTADPFLASTATTATLGPQTSVTLAGAYAVLGANGFSPFPGIGQSDTLDNQGSITAALSGGALTISGFGTFLNQGMIAVSNGATLTGSALTFANTGTLTVGQGGTVVLGAATGIYGATPSWSNTGGRMAVAGGTLVLDGGFTTSQLGSLTESGGLIDLAGTLANSGGTLTLGAASGLADVELTGTVTGGTIADASGALAFGTSGAALLQGVAYQGTLSLDSAGATLDVQGGLTVSGQVDDQGEGALLAFIGSQGFGGVQLLLGAPGQAASLDVLHNYAVAGADTLTLGAHLSIVQSGALAALGTPAQAVGDEIVSGGTITAAQSGGTFTIGGQGFSNTGTISVSNGDTLAIAAAGFSNTGLMSAAGATLLLADSLTLAELGQLSLNDATLAVSGTLNLGGGTLSLGTGSQIGQLSLTGTLANGIVSDSGGGLAANGNADLSAIIYQGLLDLSRPFTNLRFSQGLTVLPANGFGAGAIAITGAESRLIASNTETLNDATVTIGAASQTYEGQTLPDPELAAAANATLTLGPSLVVTAVGAVGQLGDPSLGDWTDAIINQGRITDAVGGNGFNLDATSFYNPGTITVSGGGVIWINDAYLQNSGVFNVGPGSVVQLALFDYFAAPVSHATVMTNTGTIAMGGGIFHEMNAGGLFPGVPLLNAAGAQIAGNGTVISPVSNAGTIEAKGGQLTTAGTISGNGSLLIGQGATLDLATTVGPGQLVTFLGSSGTLALSQPASFTGLVTNFGGGDVIDLPGQTASFVAISNGTLAVNTPTQSFFVGSSTHLAGALMAGPDGHGGETIDYVPRSATPGPTTLSVTEPRMLFWTTPSGDILTGATANLNGAFACNWSQFSSLDLTDMNPALASVSVSADGARTIARLSDGTHSCSVTFNAAIGAAAFHLSGDGHGGTSVTT
jgi:hypothetical protein